MDSKITSAEQKRGYESAQKEINKGKNPQDLFDGSLGDLNQEGFARGWQIACSEAGAKDKEIE